MLLNLNIIYYLPKHLNTSDILDCRVDLGGRKTVPRHQNGRFLYQGEIEDKRVIHGSFLQNMLGSLSIKQLQILPR